MPAAKLRLELTTADAVHSPIRELAGVAMLTVPAGSSCSAVTFGFELRSRGSPPQGARGRAASNEAKSRVVLDEQGIWGPGEHEVPFRVPRPRWPPSHRGEVVQISWRLWASARLGSDDIEASIPFELGPGTAENRVVVPTANGDRDRVGEFVAPSAKSETGSTAAVTGVLALALWGAGVAAMSLDAASWGWFLAGGIATAIALFAAAATWAERATHKDQRREIEARHAIYGAPQRVLTFDPEAGELEFAYWVRPQSPELVATAELTVDEITWNFVNVIDGPSLRDPHRHVIDERTVSLQRAEPGCYRGRLSIPSPQDAPDDFDAPFVKVRWTARIRTDVEGLGGDGAPLRVRAADVQNDFGEMVM